MGAVKTMTTQQKQRTLDDFFKRTYSKRYQSVWTATLGQNQSGKTAWNLYQMQRLHALGLYDYFGANIPDMETPFKYDFIEDFPTLKKRCQLLNPNPEKQGIKRYLFLGTEMGDWIPQDQPWENVKLIKELQQVRKYGLNFLGDGISRIDQRVLNEKHFHGYFEKAGKKRQDRAVYYDWLNRRKVRLYDIPMTTIKYGTWYSAMFYMEEQPGTVEVLMDGDRDILIAVEHARGRKYPEYVAQGGDLSKQGYYNARDKGVIKLYEIAKSSGQQIAS